MTEHGKEPMDACEAAGRRNSAKEELEQLADHFIREGMLMLRRAEEIKRLANCLSHPQLQRNSEEEEILWRIVVQARMNPNGHLL